MRPAGLTLFCLAMLFSHLSQASRALAPLTRRWMALPKAIAAGPISDTIFALSSGSSLQKTGVAVVRISGPHAFPVLAQLLPGNSSSLPPPRKASLRKLFCPDSGDMLDQALVLCFPSPSSFTGEDVVELHCHGSRAVITGLFSAFDKVNQILFEERWRGMLRPAERGEFTQRAFENGKMDLTEVEGLADLLEAETSLQRKQALQQMEGHLRVKFEAWRQELVHCLAHTEAVIDFGDDERESDIDDSTMYSLVPRVKELRDELAQYLNDGRRGELVREGLRIALVGRPNAGKSSLLNLLAKRPAAIVSPIAGTTRDVIEVRMDLDGIPCIISDTAGLRLGEDSAVDVIEMEGIRRAREAFKAAHIKVFVHDSSDTDSTHSPYDLLRSILLGSGEDTNPEMHDYDESERYRVIMVFNKIDIKDNSTKQNELDERIKTCSISCVTGEGILKFEETLLSEATWLLNSSRMQGEDNTLITRERHRRHMKNCVSHLDMFLLERLPMDAAAEELRYVCNWIF